VSNVHHRVDYPAFMKSAPAAYAAMGALGKAVDDSGLEKSLTELMKVRVSQINRCAFCLQYHLNLARKIGIPVEKLDLLAAWREAGVYTAREMAALSWAEDLTMLPGNGASNQAWSALLEHFSISEAMFLTISIATINSWNRIGVGLEFSPPIERRAPGVAASA
jgi:AhpD family alkylhydroperoxidase